MSAVAPEFQALRDVCCAEELKALRERNAQRAEEVKQQLGARYLCHPDNRVRPAPQPRGVLAVGNWRT